MRIVRLGDVCEFRRGLTYKKTEEVDSSSNIVLRANNIDLSSFKLTFDELRYINESINIPESKMLRKDSLLICTASGSKSHLGKVAYIEDDYPYAFGGFMGLLVPNDQIYGRYLYKILTAREFRDHIDSLTDGTNINNLKFSLIEDFEFPLPSHEEQREIVARLDAVFEKIDKAIENTEENLQSIQELYEARFNNLMSEKPGGIVTLNDVCAIKSKLIDPRKSEYINCHHVGGANIESKTGRLIGLRTAREEKLISGKFAFDENTVLYSKIRPYLMKVARPDFAGICSADIYPLTPGFQIERDYLYYILLSKEFTGYAIAGSGRAGMPKVNRDHLFSYKFTLPPIDRQKEIINELNLLDTQVQKLQRLYQQKLVDLRALKQSLLREAFLISEVE